MKTVCGRVLVAAASLLVMTGEAAQSTDRFPSRPIRMIVPFAPGGASDFIARILQPKLSEELGQRVVADNRSGAAGNIGLEIAARSSPDGHTILLGNIGTMAINPAVFPDFPIKPVRDLTCITLVADVPGALGVHPSIPVADVRQLIDYARARPGQLNYGSSGPASNQRLAFEVFMKETGIKLVHVPYKDGAGAATLALLSGEVAVATATVASYLPHAKNGKIKILAVIAPRRLAQAPAIPTMVESGFPDWVLGSWSGVHLPAGAPPAIVGKYFSAIVKSMNDPTVVERVRAGGAEVVTSNSPEEYTAFVRAQNELWARTVKEIGVTAD